MRYRYTLLPAVAVAFIGVAACTESGADDRPAVEADTVAVVSTFQDNARERLNEIDSLIDSARMELDSVQSDAQQELQARLNDLASRSNALEQEIRTLVWRSEMEWDSTTQRIEQELGQLRRDVDTALSPDSMMTDSMSTDTSGTAGSAPGH
jgi:chromosome segregation ATPase